jgi:hypothetical protein
MKKKTINFVQDFTDTPGGRYRHEGPFSGEQFRDEILEPAVKNFDEVLLNLNGAIGFPSSFIDEAFGGLIENLGYDTVTAKLKVLLDDDDVTTAAIRKAYAEHRDRVVR